MLGSFHFAGGFDGDSSLFTFMVKLVTEDTLCFESALKCSHEAYLYFLSFSSLTVTSSTFLSNLSLMFF